jgi:hypothetical protein
MSISRKAETKRFSNLAKNCIHVNIDTTLQFAMVKCDQARKEAIYRLP